MTGLFQRRHEAVATLLPTPLRRARHRLRTRVSEYPALYLPFARRKYPGPSPEVIGPQTELVIDGYTRSATTFAVYAFQLCQVRPVRLAHHLHAPAQLLAAARGGVPVLALIREPKAAILSQLIQEPGVALPDALIAYTRFYTCLLRHRDSMVVGDFQQVTGDYGQVIRRLNERFGTSFAEFISTAANMTDCLELMKHRGSLSKTLLGFESGLVSHQQMRRELTILAASPGQPISQEAWVPSRDRNRLKTALSEQWLRPGLAGLRERANNIYSEFRAESGARAPACR